MLQCVFQQDTDIIQHFLSGSVTDVFLNEGWFQITYCKFFTVIYQTKVKVLQY